MKNSDKFVSDPSRKDDAGITGKTFGRLLCLQAVGYLEYSDRTPTAYLCQCSCGQVAIKAGKDLISGHTLSCGCLQKEAAFKTGKKNTKPLNDNPAFIRFYKQYASRAKRAGLEFSLEEDFFREITSSNCHYCNQPATKEYGENWKGYSLAYLCNGIDRKDNTKGYTIDNVLPCCTKCNYAKRTDTYEDFINWVKRIGTYQLTKNNNELGRNVRS